MKTKLKFFALGVLAMLSLAATTKYFWDYANETAPKADDLFIVSNQGTASSGNIRADQLSRWISTNSVSAQATHATNADTASAVSSTVSNAFYLNSNPSNFITSANVGSQQWGTNAGVMTNTFTKQNLQILASGQSTFSANISANAFNATDYVQAARFLDLNNGLAVNQTVYAVGTAYTLTGTAAALDFGTTDPALTITGSGTYLILATVGVKYSGATYVAAQTVTFKLRRTNNTAADLANGGRTVELPVLTTFTGGDAITLPPILYMAAAGDAITIFGQLSAAPSAGSVVADSAEIVLLRILP